jgi:hypothetical protein
MTATAILKGGAFVNAHCNEYAALNVYCNEYAHRRADIRSQRGRANGCRTNRDSANRHRASGPGADRRSSDRGSSDFKQQSLCSDAAGNGAAAAITDNGHIGGHPGAAFACAQQRRSW